MWTLSSHQLQVTPGLFCMLGAGGQEQLAVFTLGTLGTYGKQPGQGPASGRAGKVGSPQAGSPLLPRAPAGCPPWQDGGQWPGLRRAGARAWGFSKPLSGGGWRGQPSEGSRWTAQRQKGGPTPSLPWLFCEGDRLRWAGRAFNCIHRAAGCLQSGTEKGGRGRGGRRRRWRRRRAGWLGSIRGPLPMTLSPPAGPAWMSQECLSSTSEPNWGPWWGWRRLW